MENGRHGTLYLYSTVLLCRTILHCWFSVWTLLSKKRKSSTRAAAGETVPPGGTGGQIHTMMMCMWCYMGIDTVYNGGGGA